MKFPFVRPAPRAATAWLAFAWAAASAQPLPTAPPEPSSRSALASAVNAAWERTLAEAEAEGQSLRADASRAVARSLFPAPPAVEFSHRDGRWAGRTGAADRETELATALPLWLPGQRSARSALADAESDLAAVQRAHGRWLAAGQVRETAWATVAARTDTDQALARQDTLRRLADDVDRRVRTGELARADALAARAEALAAQAALADAELRLREVERRWQLLTGLALPPGAGWLDADAVDGEAPPADHPEIRFAERSVEQAQRQLKSLQASRRAPPELVLRYRQETGAITSARDSVGVGVRIPLGSDVRSRPVEAQATSALFVAKRQLARAQDRVAAVLAETRAALAVADARVRSEEARAALLRERSELVQRAFAAGEFGLPETLRVVAADAAARADLERARAALGLARARVAQARGITP